MALQPVWAPRDPNPTPPIKMNRPLSKPKKYRDFISADIGETEASNFTI